LDPRPPSNTRTLPPAADGPAGRQIDGEHYAAIHRALLAGLLANVGMKKEQFEYVGTRGRKFHLFPGSGQFSRRPPWVVAAEVTETTKLYARTVGRIEPEWVEQVGAHLLHREYAEPYYHRDSAHVLASEKVTLFGLVLVAQRRVHYGPIDPKTSREIFIRQGLVQGEYHSDAPWARNNRELVREVELMEAKLRRRDLLADADSRFAFFDPKIPADVYNGPLFEKWRRQAESADKRALFMRREDLVIPGPETPKTLFPDRVVVNEQVALDLQYKFEPGDEADGVTAVVPLAVLNQLPAQPFEWLVPGHLPELVTELIRGMPKDLRVQFVPVPESARAVTPMLRFGDGSLPEQLAWQLGKRAGSPVPPASLAVDRLPDWMRMHFVVVDEAGKSLEAGRDLEVIRRKLRVELKETFEQLPTSEWHRDGITRWDFPDLPDVIEVRRPGLTVRGYPAVVDAGAKGVSLRVLDSAASALVATKAGLRKLFLMQIGDQAKSLQRNLPGVDRMCLQYATIGPCDDLKREIVNLAADRALFGDEDVLIRKRDDFIARAERAWQRLTVAANEVCAAVGESLETYQSVARRLAQPVPPFAAAGAADVRQHLADLMPRGFVAATPWAWLKHYPRYLKAIDLRLKKLLAAGATRDAQSADQIRPIWKRYLDRRDLHAFQGVEDPTLQQYRWLVEELRVSLFAQELKTSVPVSVKRLEQVFAAVR
jgi:ATP-dependent helicase HrpA